MKTWYKYFHDTEANTSGLLFFFPFIYAVDTLPQLYQLLLDLWAFPLVSWCYTIVGQLSLCVDDHMKCCTILQYLIIYGYKLYPTVLKVQMLACTLSSSFHF